ncbi:hypothetical protein [Agitococcus lubricus]|uniref:Uncharacterized protein (TIGR02646 family) n=1 Tax=Agitococcus lubricus TaxID=1077255 RepID=A0A2T5J190_9GAMM|nr:hypothetical protein [Agitococcus lubricus]PTQ90158.1 uncharacterized protein (TIGR02646 family) [Agitococcus lubricus]
MRKLTRMAAPECWQKKEYQWNADYVAKVQESPSYKFVWRDSKTCFSCAKEQLMSMTQHNCAFCDGALGVESRKTIEHFRPKESFPQLAYVWDNLFSCCDVCQSEKLAQFDESLLKPDEPTYQFYHYFQVSFRTGEIQPSSIASQSHQQRAEITINLYQLNKLERCKARLKELHAFRPHEGDMLDDFNYRFFLEAAL